MEGFPAATAVGKRMPKEAFYRHLKLSDSLKLSFVSDIEKITVENIFTRETLNLPSDSKVKEIILLSIALKRQAIEPKIIEAIARQNEHKLVFCLMFEGMRQLAVYYGKLYSTPWLDEASLTLELRGFALDELWSAFVEQIALRGEDAEASAGLPLDERLALRDEAQKLKKMIEKTEKALRKEVQPKKQLELYARLREYKDKLEKMGQRAGSRQSTVDSH